MTTSEYIDNLNKHYTLGNATEHTFRGDLQVLIESLVPEVIVTNEPKRQSCGAPDYILTKKDIPVGFIEAKDIGDTDLEGKKKTGNKEQFDRYRASLPNLIFTDYLIFHFYHEGELQAKVAIGEVENGAIKSFPENFSQFESLIKDFSTQVSQTIKSPKKLAQMMAGKARLLSDVIEKSVTNDEDKAEDSTLKEQMDAFKNILIHDITPKGFADVYAQTIAYGMFAARLHDETLEDFSRQEAAELIPKSNPFLRKLFGYIAGPDIDDRIKWIVDSLAEVFLAANVEQILKNYGKSTKMDDPIIHFYETFLSEYDPKLRKARGVWYTPQPVVNFIVRAVDDILKTEFGLSQGLADTSKTKVKTKVMTKATADTRSKMKEQVVETEVHRVQILDPATGTGTFLAEVVKHIHKKFEGQQGIWGNYVENHLLPRLNGFELLMASYAMAHLKLDLLLRETGYKTPLLGGAGGGSAQRFRVYLTNSLEESHPDTGTLFANWLSAEANEANHIKRDTPVMCVIGNPPYSGESANKGDWIMSLMEDYKKEPGGKEKLKERNPKWINDDYVKFLRYGQHFIEKNGSGVLAFINPHGFLDNPTFRGMRWNLLKTYDKIYTIDLHGNSKKKETAPDGSVDQNVFDIMQGVSINIFVKTGKKRDDELGKVYHHDLYGKRDIKYDFLIHKTLGQVGYVEIPPTEPMFFMSKKDFRIEQEYSEGFSMNDLFEIILLGPNSHRDDFAISFDKASGETRIDDLRNSLLSDQDVAAKYGLKDNRDWKFSHRRRLVTRKDEPIECLYRPFDNRFMLYGEYAFDYHRPQLNDNLLYQQNFGFVTTRQTKENFSAFITNKPLGQHKIATPYDGSYISPLYLYPEKTAQQTLDGSVERTPNLDMKLVQQIAEKLGMKFVPEETHRAKPVTSSERSDEKSPSTSQETSPSGRSDEHENKFAPIDLLDYIYAVLHSPAYREKYKEFLKIDFPRVPYPKDARKFWELVKLGGEIRQIHLLESSVVEQYLTKYPIDGDNVVEKPRFEPSVTSSERSDEKSPSTSQETSPSGRSDEKAIGRVFINGTQYFEGVPETAWNFYIGGYQPAQKWLKDRKGRELQFDDILHYQKIIVALSETDRLMKEVDKVGVEL